MTRVFAFKGKVFCGVFNIFANISDWKQAFCMNNAFDAVDVSIVKLSDSDIAKYDAVMQSANTSRVIFEDTVKLIGTQLVDDKEIIIESFTQSEII